jgi:hypothetical protein
MNGNPPFMLQGKGKKGSSSSSPPPFEPSDNEMLKYAIAAIAVGTCIGNMFVSRRVKSFLNMKNPTRSSQQQQYRGTAHPSSEQGTSSSSSSSHGGEKAWQTTARRARDARNPNEIPHHLHSSLITLNLSTQNMPTKKEVKDAYRLVALKVHPDRKEDKDKSDDKFKEATDAYKDVLAYLDTKLK